MAFKKSKSKAKAKAKKGNKKGKSGTKDSWTHEGGVHIENADPTPKAKGPRQTQERDERLRRGKRKMFENNKAAQAKRKMSHKLSFDDILNDGEDSANDEDVAPKKVKLQPKPKSQFSVMSRLQYMMNNDEEQPDTEDEDDEEDEFNINDYEIEGEDTGEEAHASDDDHENGVEMAEEVEEPDVDEAAEDNEKDFENSDDENDANGTAENAFNVFFGSAADGEGSTESAAQKSSSVIVTDTLEMTHQLTRDKFMRDMGALGDIPGLHKLWRSRSKKQLREPYDVNFLPSLSTYADVFIEGRDHENDRAMIRPLLIHCCVHTVRARAKVLKNNYKLKKRHDKALIELAATEAEANVQDVDGSKKKSKKSKKGQSSTQASEEMVSTEGIQDQGYVRPRVLILCPFRSSAKVAIENMMEILGPNTTVSSKAKFEEEFGADDDDDDDDDDVDDDDDDDDDDDEEEGDDDGNDEDDSGDSDGNGDVEKKGRISGAKAGHNGHTMKKKNTKESDPNGHKPSDFKATFRGNIDDDFKMGIQINPGQGKGAGSEKGVYMRLFSDFYQSDIIIASPIGLKLVVEASNGNMNYDFLSSIEMVIVHQADVLYMQNWEHVEHILTHLNALPQTDHNTDFSRVRPYFLEGPDVSSTHRQFIMTSQFNLPDLHACFRMHAKSVMGCTRVRKIWGDGAMSAVSTGVKQVFQRIRPVSFEEEEEARFKYFCDAILTPILRMNQKRTLIVAPSYLSFVRIRNELIRRQANACWISEYSRDSEISRGRSRFFHGHHDIMLYSGRAHFFRRFSLRGAMHLILYSLPEYPHFYPEIVNLLGEAEAGGLGSESSCTTLFSQYEKMSLDRLVGSKRAKHMVNSNKSTFMFQ